MTRFLIFFETFRIPPASQQGNERRLLVKFRNQDGRTLSRASYSVPGNWLRAPHLESL